MDLYPLRMRPVFKDYLWGGSAFRDLLGKDTPYEVTAESWEISCHKDGTSVVANGALKGKSLEEAISLLGESLLGELCDGDRFPLLLKLIDASQRLSVQVHPDDAYAIQHENGDPGKTEMWYVVDAKPGARLIYGFREDVTARQFEDAIKRGTLEDILNYVDVKPGDCFFIEAGTVHAICEGLLIAEIQQNSNTTYRVYDWGRVGADGKPRALHIEKALEVSDLKSTRGDEKTAGLSIEKDGATVTKLACCRYFGSEHVECASSCGENADGRSFHMLLFLRGDGYIVHNGGQEAFKAGDSFVIPADMGAYIVEGDCAYFKNYLPEFETDFLAPLIDAGYIEDEVAALLK